MTTLTQIVSAKRDSISRIKNDSQVLFIYLNY